MKPVAITPGDPAGIGPELALRLVDQDFEAELVFICDPDLLKERAEILGGQWAQRYKAIIKHPRMAFERVSLDETVEVGKASSQHAAYLLKTLDIGVSGCLDGNYAAVVTGPVNKHAINASGIDFSGHTEYLAARCPDNPLPVMMLVSDDFRVALVTTHLALKDVAKNITAERLNKTLRILSTDLQQYFGLTHPRIRVTGLNPHAGENGDLGTEEIDVIQPVIDNFQQANYNITGPYPADTLFRPERIKDTDAFLAMYHDQGLAVLKFAGFGKAVNVTLGLPFIRTSVDHGTAYDLAGTGNANPGSFIEAVKTAIHMGKNQANSRHRINA